MSADISEGCTPGGVSVESARERVISAVRRVLSAREHETFAYSAADAEYADDLMALAARELVYAVNALPVDEQPVGWKPGAR